MGFLLTSGRALGRYDNFCGLLSDEMQLSSHAPRAKLL